eukprot:CAMPEP_0184689372 /NCGR_PEP_ID=MMETSP0312-20130426/30617_1 /TAXON_ID=31354 /ORGANISM="Compsopogon coeruleus, Strain SAG 36.94" /LENGTH=307 /DNA_ID=CAMNT_0027146711 /DNA_START=488 /DNA_END=1411 /DNA_ORIENTATION=-
MKSAQLGADSLLANVTAEVAAVAALRVLEDHPIINAGRGSALTWDGNVECDASIMCGVDGAFGGVTATQSERYPVLRAYQILQDVRQAQRNQCGPLRPPLVQSGSRTDGVDDAQRWLKTPQTVERHRKYRQALTTEGFWPEAGTGDTAGVICVDRWRNIAVASSTGGPWLRPPGRVGPVAIPGGALFANRTVGVVCSGDGEQILLSSLASEIARGPQGDTPLDHAQHQLNTLRGQNCCGLNVLGASVTCVLSDDQDGLFLSWAQTSEAFMLAFTSSSRYPHISVANNVGVNSKGGTFLPWTKQQADR